MFRSPAPTPYVERNIFEAVAGRQQHGALGYRSPHTAGAALGSLVWGLRRHSPPIAGHDSCVNTLRWNAAGDRLVSGSDDCTLIIYDVRGTALQRLRTWHCFNIFDAQFKPNDESNIASCAADGGLCLTPVGQPGHRGGAVGNIVWAPRSMSSTMALKLSFRPGEPDVLLCSFGDGTVRIFDLRAQVPLVSSLQVVPDRGRALVVAEFSPCGDLIAAGADDALRIFDLRRVGGPADSKRAAQASRVVRIKPPQRGTSGVSGVSWSTGGRLLLANYMGGDIVMFDIVEAMRWPPKAPPAGLPGSPQAAEATPGEGHLRTAVSEALVQQRFSGRENQRTFAKEVRFLFGDRFVASGGDCGNLFIWRTGDGTLVRRLKADGSICNCVAPHPTLPLVAASGIDDTVKFFEVGGDDRPPLRRRTPSSGRGRRLMNALGAASPLRGRDPVAPCRSWLAAARRYLGRRAIYMRSLCRCRRRRHESDSEHSRLPAAA
eukprot:gnl/TRDRNA2_/TRDRNA2_88775_c0_seq2.p1 gnl/TRDRNA2_/TRDRNA2_88775_c0~~gnl/TRDRNA2_/TRDRNA2_88775_c0_seq2.p1  ORF type:complete len:489 (+),score=60.63 gnl/TRDRNA2_/TRDRNA2_88775_c0_seq2:76-1542(+)